MGSTTQRIRRRDGGAAPRAPTQTAAVTASSLATASPRRSYSAACSRQGVVRLPRSRSSAQQAGSSSALLPRRSSVPILPTEALEGSVTDAETTSATLPARRTTHGVTAAPTYRGTSPMSYAATSSKSARVTTRLPTGQHRGHFLHRGRGQPGGGRRAAGAQAVSRGLPRARGRFRPVGQAGFARYVQPVLSLRYPTLAATSNVNMDQGLAPVPISDFMSALAWTRQKKGGRRGTNEDKAFFG